MKDSDEHHIQGCMSVGCARAATHHLDYYAWPNGAPKILSQALYGTIPQALCEKHARRATSFDIFTDEGWAGICATIAKLGREAPLRTDCQVVAIAGWPPPSREEKLKRHMQ
jgi:hypothetical protein